MPKYIDVFVLPILKDNLPAYRRLAQKAGKQMCTMKGSQCLGNTYMPCDSPVILKEFLERVYGNRKVASTDPPSCGRSKLSPETS